MNNNLTRPIQKLRSLMVALLLAAGLTVATPQPAHAQPVPPAGGGAGAFVAKMICKFAGIPIIGAAFGPGCEAQASQAIATAVDTVVDTFMKSFATRLELVVGVRTAEAEMNVERGLKTNAELGRNLAQTNSESGAYCGATTAIRATAGALGGDSSGAPAPPPRPDVEMRDSGFPRVPKKLACGPGTVRTCPQVAKDIAVAAGKEIREDNSGEASSKIKYAKTLADNGLRPCEGGDAECAAAQAALPATARPYADIEAKTLFGEADTYVGSTVEERTQSYVNAVFYCINLITPGGIDRVGGALDGDKIIRQAAEKAGDARISLAYNACADVAARRVGIDFDPKNPTYDWIVTAACQYRRAFTVYGDDPATGQRRVVSTLRSSNADINSLLDANCPATMDSGSETRETTVGSSAISLSRLEMLRIISTDMFNTPQFSVANASSSQAELQRMLVAMETVNSQLNMEMLRMQEQLNLIKAAQLAADVQTK